MREATVRTSALRAWAVEAEHRGAEFDAADLAPFGTRAADLPADGEISLRRFVELTEAITRRSGDPFLGWSLGLGFDIADLGETGEAVAASQSLGGALQRLTDYFSILQDAGDVRFEATPEGASLSYRILDPDIWPRTQDALFTLGIFAKIIRSAVGPDWSGAEITLEADSSELRRDAAKVFGARCLFNGETNQIRLPAGLLDRPLSLAGARAAPNHARLSRMVASRRRRISTSVRVKWQIFQDINESSFSQESVSRTLGMSSRTLRRKLAEEGRSFQSLLDECRMQLAAFEFLVRPDVSIAQTALRLGYSEHSTFTRAFLRWNGVPPQSYIRRSRAALGGYAAQPA
jgi:AraC-like DNA-binding protein